MINRWPKIGSLVMLMIGCAWLGGCQRAKESPIWRFAIEETAGSVQDAYAQQFKLLIEAKSGGKIKVKVYPYGTLGTSDQITELLYNGSLQFAMASPGHLGKIIPEVQVLLLHYVLSESESVNREALANPALIEAFNTLYAEKGFHLLGVFSEGWQVWTTNKPVRAPEDFQGMKFRVMTSPLLLAAYRAYGASPTPLPYSDVYSALQLSMIDGQVNPVFAIEEMSFHEVTSHMVFAHQAPFLTSAISNAEFYSTLEPEQRLWVDETVTELDDYVFRTQARLNTERLTKILEEKPDMVIIKLDKSQRDRFREASMQAREQFLRSTGQRGRELLHHLEQSVKEAERPKAAESSTGRPSQLWL